MGKLRLGTELVHQWGGGTSTSLPAREHDVEVNCLDLYFKYCEQLLSRHVGLTDAIW